MAGKKRRSRVYKEKVSRKEQQVIDLKEERKKRRIKRKEEALKKEQRKTKSRAKRVVSPRKAGKKARRRFLFLIIFLVILAVAVIYVYNLSLLKKAENDAITHQQSLEKEKTRLQQELTQVNSPEYVEQQARKQLRMIKPGELLFVTGDSDKTSPAGVSEGAVTGGAAAGSAVTGSGVKKK